MHTLLLTFSILASYKVEISTIFLWRVEVQSEGRSVGLHHFVRNPVSSCQSKEEPYQLREDSHAHLIPILDFQHSSTQRRFHARLIPITDL